MQLGVILTPYGQLPNGSYPSEIGYSYGGDGSFLCPSDPYFNTRGENGYYYDTQLGGLSKPSMWKRLKKAVGLGRTVPTPFEMAPVYGYVPQVDGWIAAKEGFQTSTWIPPDGWDPAGSFGPPMSKPGLGCIGCSSGMLGDATAPIPATIPVIDPNSPATSGDIQNLAALLAQNNQKVFWLSVISVSAVVLSSLIAAFRNAHLIKQEMRLLEEEIASHA